MLRKSLPALLIALATALAAVLSPLPSAAQVPAVSGEVTKVDKPNNRVEIRHGEIKHLDMPPMKMVFRVRDPKVLDGVAVGDRIRFTAEKLEGNYTVTSITKGP